LLLYVGIVKNRMSDYRPPVHPAGTKTAMMSLMHVYKAVCYISELQSLKHQVQIIESAL